MHFKGRDLYPLSQVYYSVGKDGTCLTPSSPPPPPPPPPPTPLREQRVTLFCMAVLLGLAIMPYQVLKLLPMPVLYGIFLYIGVTSLFGVQVSELTLPELLRN